MMDFLKDIYKADAKTAFAANTIVRSFIAAGFVMFAEPLYRALGTAWATTILAALGTLLCLCFIVLSNYNQDLQGNMGARHDSQQQDDSVELNTLDAPPPNEARHALEEDTNSVDPFDWQGPSRETLWV